MHNPFADMPVGARWATAIGGAGVVGFILYKRHEETGSWNPFTAVPASSDNATPDSSSATATDTSDLGTDAGGGTGDLASIPVAGSSADLSTSSPYTLNSTYPSAAAWSQAAQAGLTSIGYDPETVAAALGAYINQQPLTAAQESIVQVAVAEYGQPDGANGLPLQILTQPAVTTSTSTAKGVVPNLIGLSSDKAETEAKAYGFGVRFTPGTSGDVVSQTPIANAEADKGSTIDLDRKEISAAEATQLRKAA